MGEALPQEFTDRKEELWKEFRNFEKKKRDFFFSHTGLIVSSAIVSAIITAVGAASIGISDKTALLVLQIVTAFLGVIATTLSSVASGLKICTYFYRGKVKNIDLDFGHLQDAVAKYVDAVTPQERQSAINAVTFRLPVHDPDLNFLVPAQQTMAKYVQRQRGTGLKYLHLQPATSPTARGRGGGRAGPTLSPRDSPESALAQALSSGTPDDIELSHLGTRGRASSSQRVSPALTPDGMEEMHLGTEDSSKESEEEKDQPYL